MDKSYIEYICSLAKLELSEKEYDIMIERLLGFKEYAEKLGEIDTMGIEPLVNVNETINVFRVDKVEPSLDRKIILDNAPEKMYGCIKVKKIVE